MGRFKRLAEALDGFLATLGIELAPWVVPVVGVVLLVSLLPLLRRTHRMGKARKVLARAAVASAAERREMEREALALVGDHPLGLLVVAEETARRGRYRVAREALERLRATGRRPLDVRRLEAQLDGTGPATVEEAALAVERFLQEGLLERAEQRLDAARHRWPHESRLLQLQRQLEARRRAPPGEPRRADRA